MDPPLPITLLDTLVHNTRNPTMAEVVAVIRRQYPNDHRSAVSAFEITYRQIRRLNDPLSDTDAAQGLSNLRAGFNSDDDFEDAIRWHEASWEHLDGVYTLDTHRHEGLLSGNSDRVEEVKAFLAHLPKPTDDEILEIEECSMCKEPFDAETDAVDEVEHPIELPCGHIFGSACIEIWLSPEKEGKSTCPYCRHQLFGSSSDFEPLPVNFEIPFPDDTIYLVSPQEAPDHPSRTFPARARALYQRFRSEDPLLPELSEGFTPANEESLFQVMTAKGLLDRSSLPEVLRETVERFRLEYPMVEEERRAMWNILLDGGFMWSNDSGVVTGDSGEEEQHGAGWYVD